jgi:gliding motility-associated-like protein
MKRLTLILFLFALAHSAQSQLVVNTGTMTPTQYVQNVLIGGGVTVSNVTFSGDANQIGEFDAITTNPYLGLDNGIVIATGDATAALGPNNSGSFSLGGGNFGIGDGDLDILEGTGVGTNDAAILEFDFIPTGDTVKFNFVFGSEEYPEFVNSINDVFGFFLSGPGIAGPFSNGADNIALIPGTSTPVTINTVNPGLNAAFYYDNTINTGPQSVQYDGYTTVITAVGVVQCGLVYHIKIAIADASDTAWDSGVFLQAGSFSSNTVTLNSSVDVGGNDSILYEGCGTAFLDFIRTDLSDTSVYQFSIIGTAGPSDYIISADSVLFLPGQDTVTLTFDAIQDGIGEPLETVTIQLLQTICSVVDTQTVTFYISDYPQVNLTMHDTDIACGSTDSVPIWVDVVGPPHTISWNTIPVQSTDTIWVKPSSTTTYYVTVTDTCGVYTVTDSAVVTVATSTPIVITTPNDVSKYCPQDSVWVYASATGSGVLTYNWAPGGLGDSLYVSPTSTTTYVVSVSDNCGNIREDSVTVIVPDYVPLSNIVTTIDDTICSGDQVNLSATVNGGVGTYLSWNHGAGTSSSETVYPTVTTNYILTAQDSCGAIALDSVLITVLVYPPLILTTSNDTTVCVGELLSLYALASGGEGTYSYSWNGQSTDTTINIQANSSNNYNVSVTDGCGSVQSNTIFVSVTSPTAYFNYEYLSEFGVQFTDSSYYDIVNTWWTFDVNDTTLLVDPFHTFYSDGEHDVWLIVQDVNGCFDTIMRTINPPMFIYGPNSFTPDGDGVNDSFKFKGMGIETFELLIFNRWGDLLFSSNNIENGWNGTYKGNKVPVGAYVYKVRAESYEKIVHEKIGSVSVLR